MAEEIKQTLGFDVSQSLEALNQLDAGFAKFQTNLQGSITNFSSFNASAGKTVAALIQITTRANEAADALNRLNSIKAPPTTPGGGLPPLPGTASGGLTGQAAAAAMAQLLGQTATAANAAAPALNNAGQAANAAGSSFQNASQKTSGFAISLETLGRVVGTQVIVRALSAIRTSVEGSFQGFIEFNKKIAEIQTIANGESLEGLAKGVRDLSDQFNAPLLDVAAAKYQILSNGFTGAADSSKVLTAALKFSKVGIADVASSADLISSALNAYGKSANEAELISAKLFKTIELGRVVGQELATSFGRVAPVAKEIGASENEILAAFASITIGGVKASEAATQIRASLTALLKPSKDAQEALRSLGFETGEQLVAARGYQGAMQALISTTDGSTTAIAKLFPNVRALNGVLRETSVDGAPIFLDFLKQIEQASSETLNKTFKLRIESDAEKVSADLNKIKNFFTADLGKELVQFASRMTAAVGGVNTLVTGMSALAPVVGTVVGALVLYNAGMLIAEARTKLLAASAGTAAGGVTLLGGALTGLVAVVAAQQLGQFIGESITRSIEAAGKKARDEAEQLQQFERDQASARIAIAEAETAKRAGLVHQLVAVARKGTFDATDAAKAANKELLEDDKAIIEKIIAGREKFAQDLKRLAINADNDVVKSRERVTDLQNQLDDRRFEQQNQNIHNQTAVFAREQQRAQQLANQAADELAKASKPEEQAKANQDFSRAEAFAKEAIETAKTTGNVNLQVQAERTLQGIIEKRIAAEKQFQAGRAADAEKLAQEAAKEEQRITELKKDAKEFLEKSSLTDKKTGELLPKETIEKNFADAKVALERFKENAFGKGATKFNLGDLISFDRLEQRLNSAVTGVEIKKLSAAPAELDKLFNQVQSVFKNRQILISTLHDKSKAAGKNDEELAKEADAQATQRQDAANNLRNAAEVRRDAEKAIADEVKLGTAKFQEQKAVVEQVSEGMGAMLRIVAGVGGAAIDAKQKLQGLRKETQELLNNPNATAEQVNNLGRRLTDTVKNVPSTSQADVNRAQAEFESLRKVFEERQKINELNRAGSTDKAAQDAEKLNTATASEAAAKIRAAEAAAAEAKSTSDAAINSNNAKQAFDGSVSSTGQIASNMERAASAAAAAAASSQQIKSSATAAQGGYMQRFATGGFAASGTDTIAASLSPRESVVNARQSERFHPQIVALNAGITPSFSQTSHHAGDVNINGDIIVNESKNGKASANQLIDLIRRAQRRGSGSSFS